VEAHPYLKWAVDCEAQILIPGRGFILALTAVSSNQQENLSYRSLTPCIIGISTYLHMKAFACHS
jgi:hypothetical protein